ncbi:Cysteine metabolism repressor [Aedoeadaptatus ivorii]|uniref:Cysteine metabolism repressor n=1 Tax=Aedoeadaptatus ivorii TaxID=54006 RepID=A0A3S5BW94_9FIRM|nr:Rrf2 family transcriptional regulator [Peptoniphilus ivorii]MDQ0508930.1 Rrf2 family protein [Peptoniphilus ivorii]VEJ35756.1 Cysteine metabolism repressor [Peptoniphilus ivorii]
MKLSTRGRYGLMAMYHLAENYGEGPLSVNYIAEAEDLSVAYLEQLFSRLKTRKLVKSIRGAQGGYVLARPPEEIAIGDVISALEGEMSFSCCSAEDEISCERGEACSAKSILDRIQAQVDSVLDSMTLADMRQ